MIKDPFADKVPKIMADKSSVNVSNLSLMERLRVLRLRLDSRVTIASNVIIKPHVQFRLTDNAKLVIGEGVGIDSYAYFQLSKPEPTVVLGRYVAIGRHTVIAAKKSVIIGDYTQMGPYCQINDHGHGISKDDLVMNQRAVLGPVEIGRDCWIGSGVRILKGVTIGDGAVIGAGSVVTHSVPPYEIWGGVPARKIKDRT